jgi:Tfp pilus assembly protein FimT
MHRGFTLIELVVIIAVLLVMAVLYTSSTGDLSNISIDAASRKVQSDIRYAHQLAQETGINYGVVFTAGRDTRSIRGRRAIP